MVWEGPGNAGQVFLQMNGLNPELYYPGGNTSWSDNLTVGHIYRVQFGITPSNGVASATIYDLTADVQLDSNTTHGWEGNAWTESYSISFGADQDNGLPEQAYFRNLKIEFDSDMEIEQGATFTANAQIVLPGGLLIGNFKDEDYVVWAPEHAEYMGLWYGGDRGGNKFTQDGYGPNVSIQVGRVNADDANQQYAQNVPDTVGNRDAEAVMLYARDSGWVFHENGNIYLPSGGTIRNEFDVDVLQASQGVVSDWQDGINDNVWRIVPMGGTKTFDFDTPGFKEIVILAPATVTGATGFSANTTTYPGLADFSWNVGTAGNTTWWMYLGEDYGTEFTNKGFTNNAGTFTFSFDSQNLTQNDRIVIKYYTEGTVFTTSYYDNNGPIIANQTALNNNAFTILTTEFTGVPWSDFLANATSSSVTFKSWDSQIVRDVTSVIDLGGDVYQVVFDGAPIDVKTTTLETIGSAYITNSGTNDIYMHLSQTAYPDFGRYCHASYWGTTTNVYTGGTNRSGYVVIDSGPPIDFYWTQSTDSTSGDYIVQLATSATWTPASSVTVNWYREECRIQLNIYVGNAGQWNNGIKWLDWKDDFTELSANPGNGIVAGEGKVTVKAYIPDTQDFMLTSTNFAWSSVGYQQSPNYGNPYDPYRQQQIYDITENNCVPFYDFDEKGIVFTSSYTRNSYSVRLKVRVIYKFELTIGEDFYLWWC